MKKIYFICVLFFIHCLKPIYYPPAAFLLIFLGLFSTPSFSLSQPEQIKIVVTADVVGQSKLELGVTHTQYSIDNWGKPDAISRAKMLLSKVAIYQNQHLMGWGALNPEPKPGVFDWASLDKRMQLIKETGGIPVLTLCCAPDWMKGGNEGETTWADLEKAPLEEHFKDFADLSITALQRYPEVKHVQIWNQLKGFFDTKKNRWDYEKYTILYNLIYKKIKNFNPEIQVGGPYVVASMVSEKSPYSSKLRGPYGSVDRRALEAMEYWLAHNEGADFICVDGHSFDAKIIDNSSVEAVTTSTISFYSDINAWIKERTDLPIWWSEWYSSPSTFSDDEQNLLHALTLMNLAKNASVALRWGPQGVSTVAHGDQESMWSDVNSVDGGKDFPAATTATMFRRCFPVGATLLKIFKNSNSVETLASNKCLMIVNKTNKDILIKNKDDSLKKINPYGVYFSENN